jgi:hypothetical protein
MGRLPRRRWLLDFEESLPADGAQSRSRWPSHPDSRQDVDDGGGEEGGVVSGGEEGNGDGGDGNRLRGGSVEVEGADGNRGEVARSSSRVWVGG